MHVILSGFVALAILTEPATSHPLLSRALDSGSDTPLPSLTLPDGPTIPMPPGVEVFGPGGPSTKAFPPAPDRLGGKPDRPPAAEAAPPAPKQTPEEARKSRVDDLMKRLSGAQDQAEANAIMGMIEQIWQESGSDTADLLMSRADTAITTKDYPLAESLLDKVVALRPDWAEGWNRRATVRYLADEDSGSMEDISHVLVLEPRHFGALSGMGMILHRNGEDKAALAVLRKAATINPQDQTVKHLIDELVPDVEGHDL